MVDETNDRRNQLLKEAIEDGTIRNERDAFHYGVGVGIGAFSGIAMGYDLANLRNEIKIAENEGCDNLAAFMREVLEKMEPYA